MLAFVTCIYVGTVSVYTNDKLNILTPALIIVRLVLLAPTSSDALNSSFTRSHLQLVFKLFSIFFFELVNLSFFVVYIVKGGKIVESLPIEMGYLFSLYSGGEGDVYNCIHLNRNRNFFFICNDRGRNRRMLTL
jgi:hypothetical protein